MVLEIFAQLSRIFFMALQVVNTGSFPHPLSAEEEQACLVAFREHDDLAARNRLVEHNLRLVAHIIKKYYSSVRDQDDLISIGTIGLIKAINTFNYTKGVRLATYASRCVENEILMYFRANRKTAQDVSIMEPIETDKEGHSLTLMDVIAQEDTILEDLDLKINSTKLYRYMEEALNEREKEILRWRYGLIRDPLTQREVAKKLGISRSYVSRIEKKALEKLRKRFERGDVRPPIAR
ncbi:MAG: RNA polymerase sporulation sigma factor SigK, partial [Clostridia bacterium]|nr:RNA polymerase sporulation sigma factor SigK [Clostridia bacterium]